MKPLFRTLTAAEIECRVGMSRNGSVSLLLYKNARVDMALLDEVFGPFGWSRSHQELKGTIYCSVNVLDKESGQWVPKTDAGVESNTDPQKGEASDSFKRACVNWGIGRELYTAPFIWVELTETEWNGGKPKCAFKVSRIEYNDNREISELEIVDRSGEVRYSYGVQGKPERKKKEPRAFEGEFRQDFITAYRQAIMDGDFEKQETLYYWCRKTYSEEVWEKVFEEINGV